MPVAEGDAVQPQVVDVPAAARFEIRVAGALAGFVTYQRRPRGLALLHTEVAPDFEGQGIGSALAHEVLDAARREGESVLPFCPFVRAYVQRHPEYASLVPEERREEFGLAEP